MRIPKLLACAVPLFLLMGCVQSHRVPAVVYYAPAPPPTATSDRSVMRVYPSPPPAVAVPSAPTSVGGASAADVGVAQAVSQLLQLDGRLAAVSDTVEATVEDGVVTLRGTVPSEHDRYEVGDRIAKLPGVDRVRNKLEVSLR